MKTTSRLLSSFAPESMQLGPARHRQDVTRVEIHQTHPKTTRCWGGPEFQRFRITFRTADGKTTDLALSYEDLNNLGDCAETGLTTPLWVDAAGASAKYRAASAEVERAGRRGNGHKQVIALLKAEAEAERGNVDL